MEKIVQKIKKIAKIAIETVEKSVPYFEIWIAAFLGIIIGRLFIEYSLFKMEGKMQLISFYDFFNSLLLIYLITSIILNKILKVEIKKILPIVLWGYLLFLIPPFFDYLISQGKGFDSFYILDNLSGLIGRYFTFFGDRPDFGITYGIRIEIFLATIFISVYAFLKSKSIFKTILVAISNYSLLFFFGTFPSWISVLIDGFQKGFWEMSRVSVIGRFISPFSLFYREIMSVKEAMVTKVSLVYFPLLVFVLILFFFLFQKEKLIALAKNMRLPQTIYHMGLLILGLGTGIMIFGQYPEINFFNILGFIIILGSAIFSWIASVIFNDIVDLETDKISNPERPLVKNIFSKKEYFSVGITIFIFAIYSSSLVSPKISFLLVIYQIIAFFYSCPPFKLKRFPFVATFVSALASLMIFFCGFILSSPSQDISKLPRGVFLLLLIGYTLAIPIKDFKDIKGDKMHGTYTIPVVFGEYWGKVVVGSGIFISFILSSILLNEKKLFWWSVIFGSIAFWLIIKMSAKEKSYLSEKKDPLYKRIHYRNIFWWILGIISVYGIILVKIIFL